MFKGAQMYEVQNKVTQPKLYNYDPSDGVNTRVSINDSLGYIEFGAKDSFPNFLLDSVDGSHTASACLNTLNKFIKGSGFTQKKIAKIRVNPEETFSKFHNGNSQDEGYFEGYYINVRYNPFGIANYFKRLPFKSCRLGLPNKGDSKISHIYYNPYFGTGEEKEEDTLIFPVYNPNTPIAEMKDIIEVNKELDEHEQLEYKGQILFVKEDSPQNDFYPVPYYWSGYNYMAIERKVGELHNTNLDNNFFLGGILKMVGDPNEAFETKTNSEGVEVAVKTVGQAFNDKMKEFSGSDEAGTMMVLWSDVKDEFPEIEAFPTAANDALYSTMQSLAIDAITIAVDVLPILANIQTAGKLGGSQEISNAVALLNGKTIDKRTGLEDTYDMLFENSIWKDMVEPVEIIPFAFKLTDIAKIEVIEEEKVDAVETTEETGDNPSIAAPEVVEEKLQKETSFNGAQITSALEIVQSVAAGSLSLDQGVTALMEFLRLDEPTSRKLLTK